MESEGLGEDLIVIGIDDSEEILNYVTSGALDCTIAQDFYTMGYERFTISRISKKEMILHLLMTPERS